MIGNIPPLEYLGPRIAVFGPSNAGKSTLAHAIGIKLDSPITHLDVLHHLPNTNWEPRPADQFASLHEAAIAADKWVMEGNYMALLKPRLARATGVILLGSDRWSALGQYLQRTLLGRPRSGMLEGATDRINLNMLQFIVMEQPRRRQRDIALLRGAGLPMVQTASMAETKQLYRCWLLR